MLLWEYKSDSAFFQITLAFAALTVLHIAQIYVRHTVV